MNDGKILELIAELDELAKGRDDAWQITMEEGWTLHQIALATGAKRIVEVGSSYGFSGLFWGLAVGLVGGRVDTIDRDPKKFDSSKATFAKAGLGDVIVNHLGDAREILAKLAEPIDLAFIDADKPSTLAYFELLWPKLRVGGSVLTDNAATHRKEMAPFVAHVRGRSDAKSIELSVGHGVEWTVKK